VFLRIRSASLTLRAKKWQFAAAELDYLGHHISLGRVQPRMKKVEALLAYLVTVNHKQLVISGVSWILLEVCAKLRTDLCCTV